jgi:coenzyme F420-reducing hydrogenase delta subunit/ferredoxin
VLRPALDAIEGAFDRAFPPACNPWRQLGGLAYLLFWIAAATGIYVYVGFDTRADGAYASVERLSSNAFPLGSLARSLHRYASDAFLVVTVLHLVREWVRGRYAHFRRFSWTSGVVTLWLVFASGIGGFWLVWDALAQYSLVATIEWLDALPVFGGALARNVVANEAITDRLFSLLIFLHIGFPLALLAAMWVHVQRLAHPATSPPRALAVPTIATLVLLALARPVTSAPPADTGAVAASLDLDWFYLGVHAFAEATSPMFLWTVALGSTALMLALPWLSRAARAAPPPPARVDPANCNGCGRCFDDCPYAAVSMAPRSDGRALARQAVVDAALCAACGICAGACPSSTPFRAGEALRSGIDMPGAPIGALRAALERALDGLARAGGDAPAIVVFGCGDAHVEAVADARTAALPLVCAGQLPPPFIEYALRAGADGVVVTGCREGDCDYRLGDRWTNERVRGARPPRLRASVDGARVRVAWHGRGGERALRETIRDLRASLVAHADAARSGRPKRVERTSR